MKKLLSIILCVALLTGVCAVASAKQLKNPQYFSYYMNLVSNASNAINAILQSQEKIEPVFLAKIDEYNKALSFISRIAAPPSSDDDYRYKRDIYNTYGDQFSDYYAEKLYSIYGWYEMNFRPVFYLTDSTKRQEALIQYNKLLGNLHTALQLLGYFKGL